MKITIVETPFATRPRFYNFLIRKMDAQRLSFCVRLAAPTELASRHSGRRFSERFTNMECIDLLNFTRSDIMTPIRLPMCARNLVLIEFSRC